jgi:hypothetical protein
MLNQAPTVTSVTPALGSGTTKTFTAVYNDPNGVGSISTADLEIGPTLSNVSVCAIFYVTDWFFLSNDAGTGLLGPVLAGTNGSVQNSQCTLTAPSVSNSGAQLTLTLPITFDSAFSGSMETWMFVAEVNQLNSGFKLKGFWTVP